MPKQAAPGHTGWVWNTRPCGKEAAQEACLSDEGISPSAGPGPASAGRASALSLGVREACQDRAAGRCVCAWGLRPEKLPPHGVMQVALGLALGSGDKITEASSAASCRGLSLDPDVPVPGA